ncbi:MAG: LptF/LptG family permease [Verrucomicrobiales bacterium]|jgi:lipopolysaccharide export system permease protein|nr:LptF/LptG family permease [Verrucomicrobiales bacterium]
MKIIDRYLLTHLLLPFLFCLASLFCIFVIIDLFGSMDDFLKAHTPLLAVAHIYAVMFGQVAPLLIPFAFFLACVYLLGNLSAHKELVALMSAGVSLSRLVVPFFLIALCLAGVEYYLYLDLAPTAATRRAALTQEWSKKNKPTRVFTGVVYKNPRTGVMWYIQHLDTASGAITQAEINLPDDRGGDREKFFVARGNYRNGYWDLVGIRQMTFSSGAAEPPHNLGQLDATFLTESPCDLAATLLRPDGYPWRDLHRFITAPYQPSPPRMAPYKTEYFRRLADPLLAPLLCLFAFAAGIVHDRKNRASAMVNCMLILVSLFIVTEICNKLGNRSRITPELAGWFPVLTYGGIALALFIYRVGIWWEFVYLLKSNLWPRKAVK